MPKQNMQIVGIFVEFIVSLLMQIEVHCFLSDDTSHENTIKLYVFRAPCNSYYGLNVTNFENICCHMSSPNSPNTVLRAGKYKCWIIYAIFSNEKKNINKSLIRIYRHTEHTKCKQWSERAYRKKRQHWEKCAHGKKQRKQYNQANVYTCIWYKVKCNTQFSLSSHIFFQPFSFSSRKRFDS